MTNTARDSQAGIWGHLALADNDPIRAAFAYLLLAWFAANVRDLPRQCSGL